jgi:hypothetical protein
MHSTQFDFLYVLALFSPADLATMVVLVGIIAMRADEEQPLTMRGAFALMLAVGSIMMTVSFALSALGAPRWVILVAYFAVWWGVLTLKAKIAPLAATVAVVCLVGVNLLGHAFQNRIIRSASKETHKSSVVPLAAPGTTSRTWTRPQVTS